MPPTTQMAVSLSNFGSGLDGQFRSESLRQFGCEDARVVRILGANFVTRFIAFALFFPLTRADPSRPRCSGPSTPYRSGCPIEGEILFSESASNKQHMSVYKPLSCLLWTMRFSSRVCGQSMGLHARDFVECEEERHAAQSGRAISVYDMVTLILDQDAEDENRHH